MAQKVKRSAIPIIGVLLPLVGVMLIFIGAVIGGGLLPKPEIHDDECISNQQATGIPAQQDLDPSLESAYKGYDIGTLPLGVTCRWQMKDGRVTTVLPNGMSPTYLFYGGLVLFLVSVVLGAAGLVRSVRETGAVASVPSSNGDSPAR